MLLLKCLLRHSRVLVGAGHVDLGLRDPFRVWGTGDVARDNTRVGPFRDRCVGYTHPGGWGTRHAGQYTRGPRVTRGSGGWGTRGIYRNTVPRNAWDLSQHGPAWDCVWTYYITLLTLPITLYHTYINKKHAPLVKHTTARMKCLHGEPCAHSTTQKGSFWFCNQNPNCYFLCPRTKATHMKKPLLFGNLQNNHILAAKSTVNSRKCT